MIWHNWQIIFSDEIRGLECKFLTWSVLDDKYQKLKKPALIEYTNQYIFFQFQYFRKNSLQTLKNTTLDTVQQGTGLLIILKWQ